VIGVGSWSLRLAQRAESDSGWAGLAAPPRLLDRQGWSTLFAGFLLLLISFTTNYGDDNLFQFRNLPADVQVGVGLQLAALAALAGDVELASRLRHRARNRAAEDQISRQREADSREREAREADRERNRAAEERQRAARRAQLQDGCLVAQGRVLLSASPFNRLQLSEALALLIEEMRRLSSDIGGVWWGLVLLRGRQGCSL
jgi:hypothetical protein